MALHQLAPMIQQGMVLAIIAGIIAAACVLLALHMRLK